MNEPSAPVAAPTPELVTFGRKRLSPGAYGLDLSSVAMFPLKDNDQPSTFADVCRKLSTAKILKTPEWVMGEATFETETGEVAITGDLFVVSVLRDLIDLYKDGIDPYRATWFYYDHDWSQDADEINLFFVIHDGKIVRERSSFLHCYPRVLTKHAVDDKPIWHSEPYGQEAWETQWYRKFYTETLTGQLMVLRSDEPILYHYNRVGQGATRDIELVTLFKIYKFLWIVVPLLAAIAFPMLKPYLAWVAIYAVAELLMTLWRTRKIG